MDIHFEWDPEKAEQNYAKHGVTFDEALDVFYDPFVMEEEDREHSYAEQRFRATGRAADHRLLVVVYAQRGPRIRLITARAATRAEVRRYEG